MTTVHDLFMAHARSLGSKYAGLKLSEADTRSYLIDPVLRLLGYEGVEHLRREVPVPATKEFIDYVLLISGEPQVLVEAKAQRHDLTDQHAGQCVQYAAVQGVRWCFITNGIEWLLYDANAKGPLATKRVARVQLDGTDAGPAEAWRVLSMFAREELERARPINGLLIERIIQDGLADAASPLIDAIRRAVHARFGERATGADVIAVAKRLMSATGTPVESTRLEAAEASVLPPTPAAQANEAAVPASGKRRTTLADLVAAGLLPEGASIEATIGGVVRAARVVQGKIELEGQLYDSPSAASVAIRGVESNGWVDWQHRGEPLAEIRKRLPPR